MESHMENDETEFKISTIHQIQYDIGSYPLQKGKMQIAFGMEQKSSFRLTIS